MQATRKLGAEHVVYLKQNLNGMGIIASFCDKSNPKIRVSNETWVIVGSVAEPTITNFHFTCAAIAQACHEVHCYKVNYRQL